MKQIYVILLTFLVVGSTLAQNTLPMPPHVTSFCGSTRGYWFVAPSDFTIVTVEEPTNASAASASIAIVRFDNMMNPPSFPGTTLNYTTEFLTQNDPTAGPITIPGGGIDVLAGEVIGVYGSRGGCNSYGPTGPFNTTLLGLPVTLTRSGVQTNIQFTWPFPIWQEPNFNVSRIFITVEDNSNPDPCDAGGGGMGAVFGLDADFCGGCEATGTGSALACSAGPNFLTTSVDVSGVVGNATIESVDFSQQSFGSGVGSVTVNLWCGGVTVPYSGTSTPDYSESFLINPANDGTCVNLALTTPLSVDASCGVVWVEFETGITGRVVETPPTTGGCVANGTNSYLTGPACGINAPVTFAAVGFGNIDIPVTLNMMGEPSDEQCCAPGAGTQDPETTGFCAPISDNLSPDGSVVTVSVEYDGDEPVDDTYNYAWVITNAAGIILDVIPSANYNTANPGNFSDNIDMSGLGLGQYCIHGLSYWDGDNPDNMQDPTALTLAVIQSLIGQPAAGVAALLTENDGSFTGAEDFCADLNVEGCTQVVINPTPEFVLQPEGGYGCDGDIVVVTFSSRVGVNGPPNNVNSTISYELQLRNGSGGWNTVQTLGAAGGTAAPVAGSFDIEADSDMECAHYRVVSVANHDPGPFCREVSDDFFIIAHVPRPLVCNDRVNVSLTDNCNGNFNAISFLEGERDRVCGIDATDYYDFFYDVTYITPLGIRLTEGDNLAAVAGTCLTFEVEDLCTEEICWGTVCLDDKILPELTCDCPVLGSSNRDAYSEDCRLKCYQKDLIQNGIESVVNTGSCNYVPFPLAADNCENIGASYNNPNLVHSDEWIEGDCGEWWLRRSFQLMTSVRNEATGLYENVVADECVYEFFVDSYNTVDTIGLNSLAEWNEEILPNLDMETGVNTLFLPIAYIELGCNRDVDPATLASLSGFDLPGNPAPSGDNTGTSGDIEVEENNEGIIYGYPFYFAKGAGCGFYTQRVAPDVCNIVADYTDQIIDSCGDDCYGNRKTLREWTILDWCEAELINWNQLIKTVDTTPPTMSVQNITVSVDPWTCSADALLPAPDFLHDDCDDRNLVYTVNNVSAITISGDMANGYVAHDLTKTMPGEPHVFFYEAADCCGNEAVYAMNVTVVDLTAPVPVTLQNIVLSLTSLNPDTSGIAKIFVDDIDNGSYDECSGVHLEIRRVSDVCGFIGNATYNNDGHADDDKDDPDGGQYVKFCCDDLDDGTGQVDVMLRVWDDADMDGFYGTAGDNYNESWVTVTVEDKLGGGAQCPPNLILTCDMSKDDLTMTGVPGANISTCSTSPVDSNYTDLPKLKRPTDAGDLNDPLAALGYGPTMPPFDPVCRIGAIERTWASCGQQWIVFVDNGEVFDDETIVYPADATVDCIDFELGEPSWEEVACQLIGYSLESDTFLFEDGACMKVLNHFTVINWCEYDAQDPTAGGIWSWTQTTKLIDTDRPTVEYTGETCFAVNVDCESDDVVLTMSGDDAGDCPSPWLKWEVVIDLWGDGSADHTYTSYTLTNSPYYIAPSARGEEISVTIPAGVEVSKVDHLVYITVGDGCGNVTSILETIEIVDKKKPTPYCINLSTALMQNGEVELWACDFNEGSFDNCTASEYLRYTFSAVNPDTLNETAGLNEVYDPVTGCSSRVFTNQDMQDADAEGLIQVDMYAWDECGNYDFCTVNLRLINNQGRAAIEGSIQTEDGRDVKDVEVSIVSDSPEYPSSTMTDAEGHYAFSDNPIYADYTVSGEKNDDYLNGVSTLDVVMIQRHVLGLKELSSGYKLIAADINSDAKVSTIDLIELRKLILGIYSELPNNDSWRFASEAAVMNDENPWSFVEEISISGLSENMMNEDYVGIKIGDVNESVELGLTGGQSVDGRSKNLELIMDETSTGDRVELAVRSSNFADIYGYQFTMEQSGMILEEVVSGAVKMDNSNVAQLDANTITVSWNNEHGVSATEDAVLFTMIFSGSGSELAISSRRTKAEAYSGSTYETMGVSLRGDDSYTNVLYQNEPNPFADLTQIAFELSSAGSVELSISDLSGKLLKVVRGDFASGYNVISISSEELGATGVMYYTLESGDFVATKKMVVIK